MSWEAVAWANRQRMRLPQEQLVLLVLANCADPEGVAFSQWRGRDHWWTYLVKHTRLSRSSVFRHLNTIEELGLGMRSMLVLADGTKRPTMTLDLTKVVDQTAFDHQDETESESHGETAGPEMQSQGETQSHGETEKSSPQSHGETGAVPPVGPHIESKSDSTISPLPPSGGAPAVDELFDQFVEVWRDPIPKMALARSAWEHIASAKRAEVVAAARGYWAWLKVHPKPPSAVSAQAFLRDTAGWAQWLKYSPGDGAQPVAVNQPHPLRSPEGRAIRTLHEIAGLGHVMHSVMIRNGAVSYLRPVGPRLLALAESAPRERWVGLTRQQAGAWDAYLRDLVTLPNRRPLREGALAPWAWPPKADGTIYQDHDQQQEGSGDDGDGTAA